MGGKVKQYILPDLSIIVNELQPWIKGFVQKEYSYLDTDDQNDLVQEGCLNLIQIVNKITPNFKTKNDFHFYIKAAVRNAIRDYIYKLRSRFDISLYKLRRHLRQTDQTLSDFMENISQEYFYLSEQPEGNKWPHLGRTGRIGTIGIPHDFEWASDEDSRQRRLSMLSQVEKSGRTMSLEECRKVLQEVIREVKKSRNCK